MKVFDELLHQIAEVVARSLWKALDVQRQPLVLVGGDERQQFLTEALAGCRIGQKLIRIRCSSCSLPERHC